MSVIKTVSNKSKREISLEGPDFLDFDDLNDLIESVGADIVMAKAKAQLTVDYRRKVRDMQETLDKDEAGNEIADSYTYTDEAIATEMATWKPELRQIKSRAEKIAELVQGQDAKSVKEALAAAGFTLEDLQDA